MPPANNWYGGWHYNTPYQQQQQNSLQQQQQPVNNILRVTGPESAKAYSIPADSNVILFDANNPVFYLKTTDDGGFPHPLRTFKFEEIKAPDTSAPSEQIDTSNFATKDDLEILQNNVLELKEMLEGLVS